MTLKEYSEDYASAEVRTKIEKLIAAEIERVPHPKIRAKAVENIKKIALGERDFRF
jgi:2-iminoacetate synthase